MDLPILLAMAQFYFNKLKIIKPRRWLSEIDERTERNLSDEDVLRLSKMEAIYVNNQGKLLAYSVEDTTLRLTEISGDGKIPLTALFPAPYTMLRHIPWVEWRELRWFLSDGSDVRGELSEELSKYIWPLDRDAIHVQFISATKPYHCPFYNGLTEVLFDKNERGNNAGYCLAACNDGTVKWLPQPECRNGSHMWTVHLFDSSSEGDMHICQRLLRRGPFAHNDYMLDDYILKKLTGVDDDSILRSEIERIEKFLSHEDTLRLINMESIYVNNQGKFLAYSVEDNKLYLVEKISNGEIPQHALFPVPYSRFLYNPWVNWKELLRTSEFQLSDDDHVRGEMSEELSNFIWPFQDTIQVQFRSRVPNFRPTQCELKVVFDSDEGGNDGEYCLVASSDVKVKWLRQSECQNGSHIWTVHLFDPSSKGALHLCKRLRRKGPIAHNNGVNVNNYFGGNINKLGSQSIHPINVGIQLTTKENKSSNGVRVE